MDLMCIVLGFRKYKSVYIGIAYSCLVLKFYYNNRLLFYMFCKVTYRAFLSLFDKKLCKFLNWI
jgi:hypothetical protein